MGSDAEARLNGDTCWAAGGGGHAWRESADGGGALAEGVGLGTVGGSEYPWSEYPWSA